MKFPKRKPTRKKMRIFHQHDNERYQKETCGAACIMMLLDYFGRITNPTPKMEWKIYDLYKSEAYKGTPASAAAQCLLTNDLDVLLLHSSPNYMDNRGNYFRESVYGGMLAEYRQRLDNCQGKATVRTGVHIDRYILRDLLDRGYMLMVQCIVPGNVDGEHDETLHWVVVHRYREDEFWVCDPLSENKPFTAEEMEGYMDTPIGQILVAVKDTLP